MLTALALVQAAASPQLKIDPLRIVECDEALSIVRSARREVWPGWSAARTPILITMPGVQDVLINHPRPPAGFVRYEGPVRSRMGAVYVRDGRTLVELDGQNTSMDVNGVRTLVVADAKSVLRQSILAVAPQAVAQPLKANEIVGGILGQSPIDSMLTFTHEAFHVFQDLHSKWKRAGEMTLAEYPSISAVNNAGCAMEAELLAQAVQAPAQAQVREAALRWLAVREDRRSALPPSCRFYEDSTEFIEGTALYVQHAGSLALEKKKPASAMWLLDGFQGYGSLAQYRQSLIKRMKGFMSGRSQVNGDLYGASPVRFRMYFSGMAMGVLLDRLGARWKDRVMNGESLTSLARASLHPSQAELAQALAKVKASPAWTALLKEKQAFEKEGEEAVRKEREAFDSAPGELVLDFSQVKGDPAIRYTPFGILRLDDRANLFRLLPFLARIGGCEASTDAAASVMYDRPLRQLHFRLERAPDAASGPFTGRLDLGTVHLKGGAGAVEVQGRRVVVRLTG